MATTMGGQIDSVTLYTIRHFQYAAEILEPRAVCSLYHVTGITD
jgi:hypothetical protein